MTETKKISKKSYIFPNTIITKKIYIGDTDNLKFATFITRYAGPRVQKFTGVNEPEQNYVNVSLTL